MDELVAVHAKVPDESAASASFPLTPSSLLQGGVSPCSKKPRVEKNETVDSASDDSDSSTQVDEQFEVSEAMIIACEEFKDIKWVVPSHGVAKFHALRPGDASSMICLCGLSLKGDPDRGVGALATLYSTRAWHDRCAAKLGSRFMDLISFYS